MTAFARTLPRLVDILRDLPEPERDALVARHGITIDPGKRIDAPTQMARALVSTRELHDAKNFPPASVELLHRIVEGRGRLISRNLPGALQPLVERGLAFVRTDGSGRYELLVPAAFFVRMRSWEGEDPRGIRALFAQASLETLSLIAGTYLGRPATPPITLALEPAWAELTEPSTLRAHLERLTSEERRVLEGIEALGGEVDTEELLDLEREPYRVRTVGGSTTSRRGVGFALERRGFLISLHPNRHVVPTEVSRILSGELHAERTERRDSIRSFVLGGDHAPRRARFSFDPGPIALAIAIAMREPSNEFREGVGTPKSLLARLGARFGRTPETVALIAAVSRALGLWDSSAMSTSVPPGSLRVDALATRLFETWLHGGAWDEARLEPETLRSQHPRDASPSGVLRAMVLDALRDLGDGRWVPWSSLEGYFSTDHRMPALARLLRRWAERTGTEAPSPLEIAKRIATESLPALGVVDLGDEGARSQTTLRLTKRGRTLLGSEPPARDDDPCMFIESCVLRVGKSTSIGAILALSPFVEIGRVEDTLELLLTEASITHALSGGHEAEPFRARLERLAELPDPLVRILDQASQVVGRATFLASAGFLWVDDPDLRETLRTRRSTSELFLDPSPLGGLLVAPGIELDRLARRLRSAGVELLHEGGVVRARSGARRI